MKYAFEVIYKKDCSRLLICIYKDIQNKEKKSNLLVRDRTSVITNINQVKLYKTSWLFVD